MRPALVWLAVSIASMIVLAFVVPLAILVRDLAHDRAIVAVEREAQTLATAIAIFQPETIEEVELIRIQSAALDRVSVVLGDGSVVGPDPRSEVLVTQVRDAAQTRRSPVPGGEAVAIPVIVGEDTYVVTSFASDVELAQNVGLAWAILAGLAIVAISLSALVADRLGKRIVEPVVGLSAAANAISHGQLEVRVTPAGPTEIEETGRVFNTMAERISALIEQERQQVANLSHRLRTPLTSLELNVDQLDDEQTKNRLADDVEELKRTVDAVIRQARRPLREGAGVSTDLAAVARDRVAFWAPLAEEQERPYRVLADSNPVHVLVPETDVEAVVDALLTNVFAHTPEGAAFEVTVKGTGVLIVEDAGAGFPAYMVGRGVSGADSTGLGLDIVRQTAEAKGGAISVGVSPLGGAKVEVSFGPPG